MGEKTLRLVLLGQVRRAIVTRADLDAADAVSLDRSLMDAAGLLEHEKAEVYDVTTGSRFSTTIVAAEADSGEVGVNGAAAHLVRPGNLIVVAVYGWMKEKAAAKHSPRIALVDDQNRALAGVKVEKQEAIDPFHRAQRKAEKRTKNIRARSRPLRE